MTCFTAEGGHFFSSLITIATLKHVDVAFRIFTREQMVTDLVGSAHYFCANTSPLSSYPEAAAAAEKITGQLCVLATLTQMRQLFLIMGKNVSVHKDSLVY